jgi:type IV pilus assembly protein PilB
MLSNEPVAAYVARLIDAAQAAGASDIHFEPYEAFYRVRLRVDGRLQELDRPAPELKERLAARLKVMAQLDIAEKRLPQDGRLTLERESGPGLDLRLSSLPTVFGEKLVLRLLAPALNLPLQQLGLESAQLSLLQQVLERPHGLVLVSGPTGSGKSSTLYASLAYLNRGDLNLCSVEDPVEVALPGVNQVAVNDKAGLGFARALRALLRQDPDVIMVGEMRDALTADIAVKAAQTGHLVLSSVHTQSAQATLARLVNMGVAPFNLASSLSLIVAQRLLRRLCPACKRAHAPALSVLRELGWREALPPDAQCFEAGRCAACLSSWRWTRPACSVWTAPCARRAPRIPICGAPACKRPCRDKRRWPKWRRPPRHDIPVALARP